MRKIETYDFMRNADIFPFPIPIMVIVSMATTLYHITSLALLTILRCSLFNDYWRCSL